MSKQTFEIEWNGATITPESLAELVRRHVYSSRHGDCPIVVRETTQQPSDDRYRVIPTTGFPMGAKQLNEIAAEGWHLRGIVVRKDMSVIHDRECFVYYFEREA